MESSCVFLHVLRFQRFEVKDSRAIDPLPTHFEAALPLWRSHVLPRLHGEVFLKRPFSERPAECDLSTDLPFVYFQNVALGRPQHIVFFGIVKNIPAA